MLTSILKALRPKQWTKNVLVFSALVFDRRLDDPQAITDTIIGAILFSLIASSIYLINDLNDIEIDKQHPKKQNRPIASGKLPVSVAWTIAVILLVISFPLAYWFLPSFAGVCAIYFILNLAYSIWLKHVILIDVLLLASFYVIRVAVGVTIIDVERFSPWLYLTISFLALFMGIGKRRAEMVQAQETGNNHREVLKYYTREYLDQLIMIVLTITILTYSLYTFFAPSLPENNAMMLTIPFVIYGIFRYLYLIQVKNYGEAPEEVLFNDRSLQIAVFLWALSVLIIFYKFQAQSLLSK